MSDIKITIEDIKDLMDKLSETGLGNIAVEDGNFKLKISAMPKRILVSEHDAFDSETAHCAVTDENATANAVLTKALSAKTYDGNPVTAPIVGTYYSAPSPDRADFVKVGDTVKVGDVLCIIESMKLMNEIQSEFAGTVTEICTKTGDAVEYKQTMMVIK